MSVESWVSRKRATRLQTDGVLRGGLQIAVCVRMESPPPAGAEETGELEVSDSQHGGHVKQLEDLRQIMPSFTALRGGQGRTVHDMTAIHGGFSMIDGRMSGFLNKSPGQV